MKNTKDELVQAQIQLIRLELNYIEKALERLGVPLKELYPQPEFRDQLKQQLLALGIDREFLEHDILKFYR